MDGNTASLKDDCSSGTRFSTRAVASRHTILVVEDDPDLLQLKFEILRGVGYNVYGFDTAEEALHYFPTNVAIDLLLADVQLQFGQSGVDLAERLATLKPALPILLMSGSALTEAELGKIHRHRWTFVRKPLSVVRLLSIIDFLLQTNAPARIPESAPNNAIL